MPSRTPLAPVVVAAFALLFGFFLAAQLRAELIVPGNRIARSEALVHSVQDLERTNQAEHSRLSGLRAEIGDLETAAARRSDTTHRAAQEVAELRLRAGFTPLRGPGVTVQLGNGRSGPPESDTQQGRLVGFQDVEDVVNVLFAGGAEAVAVNGHRVTPASAFGGSGSAVAIDQGGPTSAPFAIVAIGNRGQMEQVLAEPGALGALRNRQRRYGLDITVSGSPNLSVPASEASLEPSHAQPA